MKINTEKGIIRILYVVSCVWMIFSIILLPIAIIRYQPQFNPDKYLQLAPFNSDHASNVKYVPISGWFFQYWGKFVLFLLTPILSMWLLFALIKYLIIPIVKWIIAGFQDK